MTDDDHTSETADAAADWIRGPREPERPEHASPHGDDAGPAPAGEEPPPEAEPASAEPPAPTAPDPVAESPRPKRAPRSPRQPAAKSQPSAPRPALQGEGRTAPHAGRAGRAGQGCTGRGRALGPRRVVFAGEPARPGRPARGAGKHARAGAGPDPVRAHARLAVHVLPRRRLRDGVGSLRWPEDGTGGAALRGRSPLQFRRVRRLRSAARLRHQRLRRDAAGPVRVGPETTRSELRDRRPRPRLRRQTATGDQPRSDPRLPHGDEGLRRHGHPCRVVRANRRG